MKTTLILTSSSKHRLQGYAGRILQTFIEHLGEGSIG